METQVLTKAIDIPEKRLMPTLEVMQERSLTPVADVTKSILKEIIEWANLVYLKNLELKLKLEESQRFTVPATPNVNRTAALTSDFRDIMDTIPIGVD